MVVSKIPSTKEPKWDSGVAVSKGKQSISLLETYQGELAPRFPENESAQHNANVTELENRLKVQQANLSGQKASTSSQDGVIKKISQRVVTIRQIVVASNASKEIKDAYGVGARISPTVNSASNAAYTIISAYAQYTAWSNSVGIIEKDINELTALDEMLYGADSSQQKNIYVRKAATMDKNSLQRAVEDGVTRISSLGVHEFELSNPTVAKLFADLIPASPSKAKKASVKEKAEKV